MNNKLDTKNIMMNAIINRVDEKEIDIDAFLEELLCFAREKGYSIFGSYHHPIIN